MVIQIYDNIKWHSDALNRPTELPISTGAIHIGFFVRWCFERQLIGSHTVEQYQDEFDLMALKKLTFVDFIMNSLDGVFDSTILNTKGQRFCKAYYTSEQTKFAKQFGCYIPDYNNWAAEKMKENYSRREAPFYIANNEANYQQVAELIDTRYMEFLNMKR